MKFKYLYSKPPQNVLEKAEYWKFQAIGYEIVMILCFVFALYLTAHVNNLKKEVHTLQDINYLTQNYSTDEISYEAGIDGSRIFEYNETEIKFVGDFTNSEKARIYSVLSEVNPLYEKFTESITFMKNKTFFGNTPGEKTFTNAFTSTYRSPAGTYSQIYVLYNESFFPLRDTISHELVHTFTYKDEAFHKIVYDLGRQDVAFYKNGVGK